MPLAMFSISKINNPSAEMVDRANLKFAEIFFVNVQVVSRVHGKHKKKIIKNKFSAINTKIHKFSTNAPSISYTNTDIHKLDILKDNSKKTGIYKWTLKISGKSYIGSAIDLSGRFKNYYNLSYLEKETQKNNSMIYRALLKYGYSDFKLDILEYCKPTVLIKREQHYIDKLKPEYNILKVAGSLSGFRHSEASIELMRASKLGRKHTEQTKLKIEANNAQAQSVFVIDNKTSESKKFTSMRKAAKFIGIHQSYLAKCIKKQKIYKGKQYTIVKK